MGKVKLKRGHTLLKMEDKEFGQWELTWRYNGIFACHKELNSWMITHIPTGYTLVKKFPGTMAQLRQALPKIENVTDWRTNNLNLMQDRLFGPQNSSLRIWEIVNEYR